VRTIVQEKIFDDWQELELRAIELIKKNCPPEGYYVAFSGGKDSVVILDLVLRANVKHDTHYNITTVDPPELIKFIKNKHPEVIMERPTKTMWQLIVDNGVPPTRLMRYCCRVLKEHGGDGRTCIIGIRAEESQQRSQRSETEDSFNNKKKFVSPIFSWNEQDVWAYIKRHNLPYCELYDRGWKRIGCVGCPFNPKRAEQLEQYPGLKKAYQNSCDKAYAKRIAEGRKTTWTSGADMFHWWLTE
jgi:phosphoadenosine phosphosulfate reductase